MSNSNAIDHPQSDIVLDSEGYYSDAEETEDIMYEQGGVSNKYFDPSRRISQKKRDYFESSGSDVHYDIIDNINSISCKTGSGLSSNIEQPSTHKLYSKSRRNSRERKINYAESPEKVKPFWETDVYRRRKEINSLNGYDEIESTIYRRNSGRNSKRRRISYAESPEKALAFWEAKSKLAARKIKSNNTDHNKDSPKKENIFKLKEICEPDNDCIIKKKRNSIYDISSEDFTVAETCFDKEAVKATISASVDQCIINNENDSSIELFGKCPFHCTKRIKLPYSKHLISLVENHNDLKRRFEAGKVVADAVVSSQHRFCEYHSAEVTLLPQWIAKGYPLTIDFRKIQHRLSKCTDRLNSIYNGKVKSIFKKNVVESIEAKHSLFNHMGQNGYYGWNGSNKVLKYLQTQFPNNYFSNLRSMSRMDYLQFIMVPEAILYLISEDFNLDLERDYEKVVEIMEDSEDFGLLMHGDIIDDDFSCDLFFAEDFLKRSRCLTSTTDKRSNLELIIPKTSEFYEESTTKDSNQSRDLFEEFKLKEETELNYEDKRESADSRINLNEEQEVENQFEVSSTVSLDLTEMNSEKDYSILELEKLEEKIIFLRNQLTEMESKKQSLLAKMELKPKVFKNLEESENIGSN